MEKMMNDEIRKKYPERDGNPVPPEYEAARMVMLKSVDNLISNTTTEEIARHINPEFRVKKVIKIPKASHLLKIIFNSAKTVEKAVRKGMKINFQKSENNM